MLTLAAASSAIAHEAGNLRTEQTQISSDYERSTPRETQLSEYGRSIDESREPESSSETGTLMNLENSNPARLERR